MRPTATIIAKRVRRIARLVERSLDPAATPDELRRIHCMIDTAQGSLDRARERLEKERITQ